MIARPCMIAQLGATQVARGRDRLVLLVALDRPEPSEDLRVADRPGLTGGGSEREQQSRQPAQIADRETAGVPGRLGQMVNALVEANRPRRCSLGQVQVGLGVGGVDGADQVARSFEPLGGLRQQRGGLCPTSVGDEDIGEPLGGVPGTDGRTERTEQLQRLPAGPLGRRQVSSVVLDLTQAEQCLRPVGPFVEGARQPLRLLEEPAGTAE